MIVLGCEIMANEIELKDKERLIQIIDLAWNLFIEYVYSEKVKINKEASFQLHFSSIIHKVGDIFCFKPTDRFSIELEAHQNGKNIDIVCRLNAVKCAIELKCFKRRSATGGKRGAQDINMYDLFKDIERLYSYDSFDASLFFCYTDDLYYVNGGDIKGYAQIYNTRQGSSYTKGKVLNPPWINKWENKSRDIPITVPINIKFNWTNRDNIHFFLKIPVNI